MPVFLRETTLQFLPMIKLPQRARIKKSKLKLDKFPVIEGNGLKLNSVSITLMRLQALTLHAGFFALLF